MTAASDLALRLAEDLYDLREAITQQDRELADLRRQLDRTREALDRVLTVTTGGLQAVDTQTLDRLSIWTGPIETELNRLARVELERRGYQFVPSRQVWEKHA